MAGPEENLGFLFLASSNIFADSTALHQLHIFRIQFHIIKTLTCATIQIHLVLILSRSPGTVLRILTSLRFSTLFTFPLRPIGFAFITYKMQPPQVLNPVLIFCEPRLFANYRYFVTRLTHFSSDVFGHEGYSKYQAISNTSHKFQSTWL